MSDESGQTTPEARDDKPPVLHYARPGGVRSFDPVRRGRRLLIVATGAGAILLLASLPDAHQPGSPGFPAACIGLPAGVAGLILGILGVYYSWGQSAGWANFRWGTAALVLALLAAGLSYTSVGWRAAFRFSRGSFNSAVASTQPPTAGTYGVYRVSEVTIDSGGGTWFQTKRRDAGFIWDYWYFGFVYQPTPGEDPIGNRNMLTLWPLGNGWYAFRTRWSD